jgi:hypothetical protein
MPKWTFITNHGAVLALIDQRRQITAREIAATLELKAFGTKSRNR